MRIGEGARLGQGQGSGGSSFSRRSERNRLRASGLPLPPLPPAWRALVGSPSAELDAFVDRERAQGPVFPATFDVFRAFEATAPGDVRVVLVGQDPYHGPGQAHGLAFSVPEGVPLPPSLRNIHAELRADLGIERRSGDLSGWAAEGVLLLNTVLTVRAGEAASHKGRGWETFTDGVIDALSREGPPAVFLLWGAPAAKKAKRVDVGRHRVVVGVHPSPLSAHKGFFGSRPFSTVDRLLGELGRPRVDWSR